MTNPWVRAEGVASSRKQDPIKMDPIQCNLNFRSHTFLMVHVQHIARQTVISTFLSKCFESFLFACVLFSWVLYSALIFNQNLRRSFNFSIIYHLPLTRLPSLIYKDWVLHFTKLTALFLFVNIFNTKKFNLPPFSFYLGLAEMNALMENCFDYQSGPEELLCAWHVLFAHTKCLSVHIIWRFCQPESHWIFCTML